MNGRIVSAIVSRFFDEVGIAGLRLPNGWFGRPLDNWLRLSDIRCGENLLVVELDARLRLSFFGPVEVEVLDSTLRVSGYARLDWDWTEYGSPVEHHEEFTTGSVEFVGPPA